MIFNVYLSKNGTSILSDNFFAFKCSYFVLSSNRFRLSRFSVPIVRFYISDIRFILYLHEPSYLRLYNYCEKVGILC